LQKINETSNVEARHAVPLIKNLLVFDPPDALIIQVNSQQKSMKNTGLGLLKN